MTTPASLLNSDDLENTFLRDNSRKKSYAEILQEDNMQDFPLEAENSDTEDQQQQDRDTEGRNTNMVGQLGVEDGLAEETWEIHTHRYEAQAGQPVANEHHHKTHGMTTRLPSSPNKVSGYLASYR